MVRIESTLMWKHAYKKKKFHFLISVFYCRWQYHQQIKKYKNIFTFISKMNITLEEIKNKRFDENKNNHITHRWVIIPPQWWCNNSRLYVWYRGASLRYGGAPLRYSEEHCDDRSKSFTTRSYLYVIFCL